MTSTRFTSGGVSLIAVCATVWPDMLHPFPASMPCAILAPRVHATLRGCLFTLVWRFYHRLANSKPAFVSPSAHRRRHPAAWDCPAARRGVMRRAHNIGGIAVHVCQASEPLVW